MDLYIVAQCVLEIKPKQFEFKIEAPLCGKFIKRAFLDYTGSSIECGLDYLIYAKALEIENMNLRGKVLSVKELGGIKRDFL